jgi:serine/threonine protein kinase
VVGGKRGSSLAAESGHEATGARTLFQVGDVLNDTYQIRALLGEGGMGQVFDARDRPLNRDVAIKAYWPTTHFITSGLLQREAQALAAIQHPGLATVYTLGRHREVEYLVMERIRGAGLDEEMIRRHRIGARLPMRDTIRILLAIADVLHAVHEAGCLHRDVKPGNVMLAGRERVVLMDFGLFLPEGELSGRPDLAGSPNYMAPESIRDHVLAGAGHLVDLYALGVIAFELLAGRLPFTSGSLEEIFDQHLHAPVPDLAGLAPEAPPRLAALACQLLAKDPYDRPESEEVAWRLRAIRDDHDHGLRRALTPMATRTRG